MDNVNGEYDRFVHHLHDSAKEAESLKTTKRRLSPKTLELLHQRGAAQASGNYQLTSEFAKLCRAAIKEDLKERRAEELREAAEEGLSIRNARRNFANFKTKMTALRRPGGTVTSSRKTMEKDQTRTPEEPPASAHLHPGAALRTIPVGVKVPSQWKTSKAVLLYKKGDVHDIGNYRPICLLSVVYKLFSRVTLNRISRTLDEGQPREQAGFRRRFSTIDHIHTITKLIEVSWEYKLRIQPDRPHTHHYEAHRSVARNKLPLCLTFIDLKKAFDSVETEASQHFCSIAGATGPRVDDQPRDNDHPRDNKPLDAAQRQRRGSNHVYCGIEDAPDRRRKRGGQHPTDPI
ncbi:unnamed protein product [Heligmosomoides polygyrus]|uniref:Reverse transcriptase domain-containing protein n=1 Tax=Heligmosomoides polygyrus TaxID=6339 RepID=A0A3P7XRK7_HELPZ|nr:unnamed protein product [Heligmosomoides polygyrus]